MTATSLAPIVHPGVSGLSFGPEAWVARPGPMAGTPRYNWRVFQLPVLILALRCVPGGVSNLAYLLLMGYAFMGRRQAIMSLYLLVLCNVFTHAFSGPPELAALYRHGITFAAAFSVLLAHGGGPPRSCTPWIIVATVFLCLLLFIHSMLVSSIIAVSILKTISFALTILTLLSAWSRLTSHDRALLEHQIWGILEGLAVLGFPLAFMSYGYIRTRNGFQGLTSHPQTYGPMMGLLSVYLVMTWMTTRRGSKLMLAVTIIAAASVIFSRARIGMLVLVAGLAAGMLDGLSIRLRHAPQLLKRRLVFLATALVLVLVVGGSRIIQAGKDFVAKDDMNDIGTNVSITEAAMLSRGFIIELMMANIERHPLTGIGLGVPTEGGRAGHIQVDPIFGLPIMAPVEKGVMPVAIVEELGIPFASMFGVWFVCLFVMAARGGAVSFALLTAAIVTNFAEACFFSPGGMGMFFLVIATMAVTAGPAAARDRRLAQRQAAPPLAMVA